MTANIEAWLDQEDARIASVVRRHGWAIEYIGGGCCSFPGCDGGEPDEAPFAYTVGLFGLAHPELLVFSLDMDTAMHVLNTLGDQIVADVPLVPGQPVEVPDWDHKIIPEEVPNPGEIVFSANRFYQRPDEFSVPVLQLSYDDEAGKFPWEPGFSRPERQPRPGTFRA